MTMSKEHTEKDSLIADIARRIEHLVTTSEISDDEKVAIARSVLNLLEHSEKEVVR